ncbi:MAG: 23S rRNA (guanosine(2251)-2'-O)-methyltransferase RlmB, partial [Clostridia bacterium]|nr:23S rRNA (guanosine(2251)-2'-O)-methyltransferase RlmB [Clostridia bacterium]
MKNNNSYKNNRNDRGGRPYPNRDRKPKPADTEYRSAPMADGEFDASADETNGAVVGRNAVRELLKSGRAIDKIFVRKGDREGSITMLVAQAIERKIPVLEVEKQKLDAYACGLPHQGIVAMAAQKEYCSVEDILAIAEERGEMPLIIIADGINDPNNLGAMIR